MFLRDFMTNWMSACEIIDSDSFLGAENSYNLFTVVKDSFTVFKEEGTRLQVIDISIPSSKVFGLYCILQKFCSLNDFAKYIGRHFFRN